MKTALVLRELQSQDAGEKLSTDRLETRTKESNMYASWWVENP